METQKHIPIGIDDFKKLIEESYYFVDKSLLIKDILDSRAGATLIPRPRRFGKTLNLSLLRYFFEKTDQSNRHLFKGLKIEEHPDCMDHQGQYPVIWMTLKDTKTATWPSCYAKICKVIGIEFDRHFPSIEPILSEFEKKCVQEIINGTASQALYENSLLDLSRYLERAYQKQVMILMDEYDAPIHEGYLKGYYNEIINFMRNFLGAGFKGNTPLSMGILTGILRISKESVFSGINNLFVSSLTNSEFEDRFGLLEDEVVTMLHYFGLENSIDEVRRWYDGYQSGKCKVYNPWSIISLIKNKGILNAYWVNTSDNALIKELLKASSNKTKEELEIIIKGGTVTKPLQENIVLTDLKQKVDVLWNFLLFCGYLTFENPRLVGRSHVAELSIPNEEVIDVYENSFKSWFETTVNIDSYTSMLESLVIGDVESFREFFAKLTLETLGSFDVTGTEPELFYHALVLGMLASLLQTHEVKSNRESGYGRYDVMLIPKDKTKLGIVIEFKKVHADRNETLESEAQKALKQLEDRKYETELRAQGFKKILKLGISFLGKRCLVLEG